MRTSGSGFGGYGCPPSPARSSKSSRSTKVLDISSAHTPLSVSTGVFDARLDAVMKRPEPKLTRSRSEPRNLEGRAQARLEDRDCKAPAWSANWTKLNSQHVDQEQEMHAPVLDGTEAKLGARLSAKPTNSKKPARAKCKAVSCSPSSARRRIPQLRGRRVLNTQSIGIQTDLTSKNWPQNKTKLFKQINPPTVIFTQVADAFSRSLSATQLSDVPRINLSATETILECMGSAKGSRHGSQQSSSRRGSGTGTPRRPEWDWDFHRKWSSKAFADLDANQNFSIEGRELHGQTFDRLVRELLGSGLPKIFDTNILVSFILRLGDADGDGVLSLGEFQFLTWRLKCMENDLQLESDFIFAMFDANQDGKIDRHEFMQLFTFLSKDRGGGSSTDYVFSVMSEIDIDNDGEITKEEYKTWAMDFLEAA